MRYAYLNEDEDRTSLLTASVRALFLPPSNYPAEVHVPAKSILYLRQRRGHRAREASQMGDIRKSPRTRPIAAKVISFVEKLVASKVSLSSGLW